jgi:hypothetical protein
MLGHLIDYAAVVVASSAVLLAYNYSGQLHHFKTTIYERCLQRQAYDQSNHDSVLADVRLDTEVLHLQEQAPVPKDPKLRTLSLRYRDAISTALASKQRAADAGVIGSCAAYR